ncbi:MAG: ATP-binding cassette domain-containing protein [bacterium]
MQKIIEFEAADLGYDNRTIIPNLSFSIELGEFVGIVGPNGSGKTNLIRAIVGMLKPKRDG